MGKVSTALPAHSRPHRVELRAPDVQPLHIVHVACPRRSGGEAMPVSAGYVVVDTEIEGRLALSGDEGAAGVGSQVDVHVCRRVVRNVVADETVGIGSRRSEKPFGNLEREGARPLDQVCRYDRVVYRSVDTDAGSAYSDK